MLPVGVALDVGRVVGNNNPGEADLVEQGEYLVGVIVPQVDECLVERRDGAVDVAEVDVEQFLPLAEVADDFLEVISHLRPAAQTELQAVVRTRDEIHRALEVLEVPE